MLRSRSSRITAVAAGACLLLALGCGLLGLALQRGIVAPPNVRVELGPLIFIARGPRTGACPQPGSPVSNLCERLSSAPRPAIYRMFLFWYAPGRGTDATRILFHAAVPLRDQSGGQNQRR